MELYEHNARMADGGGKTATGITGPGTNSTMGICTS